MPSPFPGMDPYLEGEMWQEFHATLANTIRGELLGMLPSRYTALLAKRYVIDRYPPEARRHPKGRIIYPDVHVTSIKEGVPVYVTSERPPVEMISPYVEEVPLLGVEVRDIAERRLVTLIEILSPVNKEGQGASDYSRRRTRLLKKDLHLLEIDLLRGGRRIPLWGDRPPGAYYVYLSRADNRPVTQVWPVALRSPLPAVPIPLLAPDPDVSLDLQVAVNACFDLVHYERLLDYAGPPPPPNLSPEDLASVGNILCAAGLRPAPSAP
jgi:hypothetical protein